MKTYTQFITETKTTSDVLGHERYRGVDIEITDVGYRFSADGRYWERQSLSKIKDVIDSHLNKSAPPKRWTY